MPRRRQSRIVPRDRAEQRGVLAAVVAARRVDLGLRQPELADLADCSVRFITDLESGKATVRLDKVIEVLTVLGLHLEVERGLQPSSVSAGPHVNKLYQLDSPSVEKDR